MEETLYLNDSYLKEFEAEVIEVNDNFVVLNKTAFYPAGGGQPNDEGVMINEKGEEFEVVYVGESSGKINHEMGKIGLEVGEKVKCKIDWKRRYLLMKSHTATHVLSEVLYGEAHALITGGQLGIEKCRMDFDIDDYDLEKIKGYVEKANEILKKDLKVSVKTLSREEAIKIPQVSKLAKGLSEELQTVRIVSIGDFDVQADGGTHVNSTKEVGKIEFIKCDNRGKNNRRIYYKIVK
jgi:misacylated tRNA(Ala) deacylase